MQCCPLPDGILALASLEYMTDFDDVAAARRNMIKRCLMIACAQAAGISATSDFAGDVAPSLMK